MGFHVSWIASRGKPAHQIFEEIGLREAPRKEQFPQSEVTSVLLPSGWLIVFFNDSWPEELEGENLERLSEGAELMAFVAEERTMFSLSLGYVDGEHVWTITHDSNQGLEHLEVEGEPPSEFAAIRDRLAKSLEEDQDPCDYLFDAPPELSKAVTGFRHDKRIQGIEGDAFTVLERT